MQIGLKDLDSRIAQALSEYARASVVAKDKNESEQRVSNLLAKRSHVPSWAPFGLVGVAFASIMGTIPFADAHTGIFLGGMIASFASSIGATWVLAHTSDPVPTLQGSVTAEEMQAAFPALSLSPAERVYCDTILLLANMSASSDEQGLCDMLRSLNTLLSSSRQLEAQRQNILIAIDTNTSNCLEEERDNLARQLEQADDPVVRQDLQQGVRLCETRLQNARSLERSLTRITTQQMVVLQTLASVHSSLARQQVAQASLAAPELAEIQQTVGQLNIQTQSVEQAVQEVMSLRAE